MVRLAHLQIYDQMTLILVLGSSLLLPIHAALTTEDTRAENKTAKPTKNPDEDNVSYWRTMAKTEILERVEAQLNKGTAKNVILFLGDGMSVTTMTAARIYMGQLNNQSGESAIINVFYDDSLAYQSPDTESDAIVKDSAADYHHGFLHFEVREHRSECWNNECQKVCGLSDRLGHYRISAARFWRELKTYCVDKQVPDSACTSTAYLGGVKGNYGTMGVTASVARGDCAASLNSDNHVDTVLSWAQAAGKATGIVTTTTVTHASPAGNYAHSSERDWESDANMGNNSANGCDDIAKQLVNNAPGKNCKVIMGGGRAKILPQSSGGERLDGKDLVDAWRQDKAGLDRTKYVTSREQLMLAETSDTDYLLGLFQNGHMLYHLEEGSKEQPTLAEMTEVAIKVLSKQKEGFYLFVEGGRIDQGHHDTWARRALDETVEFQKAVQVAVDMLDEKDTLIVVTADHAHTMSMAGYPSRGSDILGFAQEGGDHLKYTTLSYANGPDAEVNRTGSRRDISNDNTTSPTYRYPALVLMASETHGGEDVAVYARGPWAHLFSGNYEQALIPHAIAFAAKFGPLDLHDEKNSGCFNPPALGVVLLLTVLFVYLCS